MHDSKSLTFILFGMLLLSGLVDASSPQADAALVRFQQFQNQIAGFRAEVQQKKYDQLLKDFDDPEKGVIYLKKSNAGMRFRRESGSDGHTVLVVRGTQMIIHYPKKNQALKRVLTPQQAEYTAFGMGVPLATLKADFELNWLGEESIQGNQSDIVTLTPKQPKVREYIKMLRLWIHGKTGSPMRIRVDEPSGDYTLIDFLKTDTRTTIPDQLFDLKLPKGVEWLP